jgi:hypothetical protein
MHVDSELNEDFLNFFEINAQKEKLYFAKLVSFIIFCKCQSASSRRLNISKRTEIHYGMRAGNLANWLKQ